MTTAQVRQAFLDYFANQQHQVQPSSGLVPEQDPTLLFTNAGMNQFKDVFLGAESRPYQRAVTAQRCVRAGGKHNDLDNVGYTARHHTFFEMLGNFSFGDYFKQEAITMAWHFLTEVLQLPASRLWVTVFEEDQEAEQIWLHHIGVDPNRLSRIGAKDNFWSMGDTGPCGPCSEIFYDHGADIAGGPPGTPEEDGDRYIEIWNLVFMQYNRQTDGSLLPLPQPSVDTGMGLERIAAIMQGVHSNYEIDIFQQLIGEIAHLLKVTDPNQQSLRVVADHIRSCAFLIADGVMPANEGRGYVLRRIIRRAIRHGYRLGATETFFYRLVEPLCRIMGSTAQHIVDRQTLVEKALKAEEEQFARTLERGMQLLEASLTTLVTSELPGDLVFKLYDTYGFPMDLTADICRERHVSLDVAGFEALMQAQRERAQAAQQFGKDYNTQLVTDIKSDFEGYQSLAQPATIVGLYLEQQPVETVAVGQMATVVLDRTPFYPESGGQVGDQGQLLATGMQMQVQDTQQFGQAIGHIGQVVNGSLSVGMVVQAEVNAVARSQAAANHSATHLLHAALREVLGTHVTQKGSLVRPQSLRFDFSHYEALTSAELLRVETLVNEQIQAKAVVTTQEMAMAAAEAAGAMALFGEKYAETVRVVKMGAFSLELCGGTHVHSVDQIGWFKYVFEKGVAAGVRRIEAVTGETALGYCQERLQALAATLAEQQARLTAEQLHLTQLAKTQGGTRTEIQVAAWQAPGTCVDLASFYAAEAAYLAQEQVLATALKQCEKQRHQLIQKEAASNSARLALNKLQIAGIPCVIEEMHDVDPKSLRHLVDDLKQQLGSGVIVLGSRQQGKVSLIVGVTADLTQQVHAGELVGHLAAAVGGKGGGRPDLAQAGGHQPEQLSAALALAKPWLAAKF
ncbi:MAG: alanine--tRNA ligase [Shewanellaceae bacterium]|nr:alanine--tRNA ligase [Shewanellaceae bacterium]